LALKGYKAGKNSDLQFQFYFMKQHLIFQKSGIKNCIDFLWLNGHHFFPGLLNKKNRLP
jgi:hypothetical protein